MLWFSLAFATPPTGTWSFSGDPRQIAEVERVRETILADYNVMIRPIVRNHLRHPLTIHQGIHLTPADQGTRVELIGDAPQTYTVKLDGPRLSGDEGSVALRSQGDEWILELIGAQQGRIVHRFERQGDRLTVYTTISSPRLEGEHSWVLTYTPER